MVSRLAAAELAAAADALVIALACAGDDGAFAEIVRRRQGRVRKFMVHLCRENSLGDDLAYNDGMSHAEIARATRLPLGTVKSNIARGAARLRELLPGYAGE